MRVIPQLGLAACVLAFSATSLAAELRHRVGTDETLEAVAKNYYGASWKAVYILSRDEIDPKEDITGKRVTIPASWSYRVRRGDSLAAIAKKYLGESDRHKAIMEFNNITKASDLAVGHALLMPFHLFHNVRPGETLSQISRRYYRTTRRAGMLKDYNQVDMLKIGDRLIIPIFDSATIDAKSRRYNPARQAKVKNKKPPPTKSPSSREEARERLKAAASGFHTGTFDQACNELEELLEANALDGVDEIQLIKYLGFCAVAFDDHRAARDYFTQWIQREPRASLDPVRTSPKILAIFLEVAREVPPRSVEEVSTDETGTESPP
ncbi:LysM peptidoglycan-binding domain-containing protein [Myxococcota bacterium]